MECLRAARTTLVSHLPFMVGAALVLAVLGPFGTHRDLEFPGRLAYWGGLVSIGWLSFETLKWLALRWARDHSAALPAVVLPVGLAVSGIMTGTVAVLEAWLGRANHLTPMGLVTLYLYCAVVCALVSALPVMRLMREARAASEAPATIPLPELGSAPRAGEPRFLARIPERLGRDLLALEMEDHYVRVHTALGSDLLLLRLRDAITELDGLDGLQVHRSHWVAAGAVAGVERKPDGKLTLLLRDGRSVPVSRSYAAAVRAAGWLERA